MKDNKIYEFYVDGERFSSFKKTAIKIGLKNHALYHRVIRSKDPDFYEKEINGFNVKIITIKTN